MYFKFTGILDGPYTHIIIRSGQQRGCFILCGRITMRNEEWEEFKKVLSYNASGVSEVLIEEQV